LAELNASVALTPASTLKVITTASALELLGASYRFRTELLADNAQKRKLIIRGSGDPTLGSEHFVGGATDFIAKWIDEIRKVFPNGVSEIEVDDSCFGYAGVSRKWLREDMGNYYASGAYGVSVFDNTYKLFFDTSDKTDRPKILKTDPEDLFGLITFNNTLSLNSTGKDNGYIVGEPFSYSRLLLGDIPAGKAAFSIKGDIPDPGLYLGKTLAERLAQNGTVPSVHTLRGITSASPNAKAFYVHFSPPLKDIIRVVNVKSNNHYAEHLIRAVGRLSANNAAALENGVELAGQLWQKKGLDVGSLFMYDGCGLSPSNAVSPQLLCDILSYMYVQSPYASAFTASFPKAGEEGTVRNFLKSTKLAGKVLVKSGSIANVQCYAGYCIDGEKQYVFAVMVNNFRSNSRAEVVKAIERLLCDTLRR
jgi:D-alanyl-D-alanine carboxypeptidase/D-alanyl-D-alanine-endopeptidase (penicillin-binding protein 4)